MVLNHSYAHVQTNRGGNEAIFPTKECCCTEYRHWCKAVARPQSADTDKTKRDAFASFYLPPITLAVLQLEPIRKPTVKQDLHQSRTVVTHTVCHSFLKRTPPVPLGCLHSLVAAVPVTLRLLLAIRQQCKQSERHNSAPHSGSCCVNYARHLLLNNPVRFPRSTGFWCEEVIRTPERQSDTLSKTLYTVARWLLLPPRSKKVLGSGPGWGGTVLCRVCIFSPCLGGVSSRCSISSQQSETCILRVNIQSEPSTKRTDEDLDLVPVHCTSLCICDQ